MAAPIIKRGRRLANEVDVFNHNAWDDIDWTDEMLEEAKKRIQQQKLESLHNVETTQQIELNVSQKWNNFYEAHGDKFFKDRKWIFSEFPEMLAHLDRQSEPCNIFEVGCGVGNAVAHIIASNSNEKLHIYCCDLSNEAIKTLKARQFYKDDSAKITAFQADVCQDFNKIICDNVPSKGVDFLMLVFTLSAIKPEMMKATIINLAALLKPGGILLFRDYAIYDLTQLRFKGRSYLSENYYVRADGTTSFFFTLDFINDLFTSAGLQKLELKSDNRMLVNRSKSLKMCRCWIQAKYIKP